MTQILNQRKALLTVLVAAAIAVHYLVFDMVIPKLPGTTDLSKFVKFLLSGGLLYSLIVFVPLWLYDKFLWRLINPQFDLTGVWEVAIVDLWPFERKHISAAGVAAIKPFQEMLNKNSGSALIRQSPYGAYVQEATGFSDVTPEAGVATWTAEIICTNLPGKLRVVFESSGESGEFSGRDSLVVNRRDWRGRPTELLGDAFHVIKHLDITIKGAIRYRRITRRSNSLRIPGTDHSLE